MSGTPAIVVFAFGVFAAFGGFAGGCLLVAVIDSWRVRRAWRCGPYRRGDG